MEATSLMNDLTIFSLLDQSWSSRSVLNTSVSASTVPRSVENSTTTVFEVKSGKSSSEADDATRRYSFPKSEMRKVFDKFDEDADGLISPQELRRWCTNCREKEISGSDVDYMISSVDRNNDGAVDFEEFLSLYETHCSPDEEQEDDNNRARENGAGNEEEDLMMQAFRVFDRNHDGLISAEELQAVLMNLRMPEGRNLISCEKMIRNVDRNGDGQCDVREFQEMMSAVPL